MKDLKKNIIYLAAGIVLGCIVGGLTIKSVYDKPVTDVRIERDTVTVHDTVPDRSPVPKDSAMVRWLVVKVPVGRDGGNATVHVTERVADTVALHDTVQVELPVTQKHYKTDSYQAWVSGYRPMLDSIEVYQKERVVTETVTITKKARTRRWGIGFTGGYGYDFNSKTAAPYVGVGVSYNIITF